MLPFAMLAATSASISKPVPVSDLCVPGASAFSSPHLSPINSNPSTRNLASFVDALDAASSISPVFATLTKKHRGVGYAVILRELYALCVKIHPRPAFNRSVRRPSPSTTLFLFLPPVISHEPPVTSH